MTRQLLAVIGEVVIEPVKKFMETTETEGGRQQAIELLEQLEVDS